MHKFHSILFVSHGLEDESEALKQALSLARNNHAQFKALIVCPRLPKEMSEYQGKYEASLKEHLHRSISTVREELKIPEVGLSITLEVESGSMPAQRIIRQVLKCSHDLLIKQVQTIATSRGFTAVDMELLRDCPCPVWLSRPIRRSRNEIRVAVAIDPENSTSEEHDLAVRLLQLSRSLADTCNGELVIISCWDYQFENFLRRNPWVQTDEGQILKTIMDTDHQHRAGLDRLIQESGIEGRCVVRHLRGQADEKIPQSVETGGIDILVMGTLARSGISGFVIGNTAENVLQKLGCSLLALKPSGFVSPVRPY